MDEPVQAAVMALSRRLDPDPDHSWQVCRLSMILFDLLSPLLALAESDRQILQNAALLHDTGWSVPGMPHHKASRMIILRDRSIPFPCGDREIIAEIARYHRKASPSLTHPGFTALGPGDQHRVRALSALLRVADACDRSHRAIVQDISLSFKPGEIVITCHTTGIHDAEQAALEKKSHLLAEVTGLRVIPEWT